jgi:hypothetical protein
MQSWGVSLPVARDEPGLQALIAIATTSAAGPMPPRASRCARAPRDWRAEHPQIAATTTATCTGEPTSCLQVSHRARERSVAALAGAIAPVPLTAAQPRRAGCTTLASRAARGELAGGAPAARSPMSRSATCARSRRSPRRHADPGRDQRAARSAAPDLPARDPRLRVLHLPSFHVAALVASFAPLPTRRAESGIRYRKNKERDITISTRCAPRRGINVTPELCGRIVQCAFAHRVTSARQIGARYEDQD